MVTELLKKVRKIEIKARGLSNQLFSGEYHSAFKGRGMSFAEVRSYQFGDDVRTIDWNVTARLGSPYVKVFEEERELTVMLLIDVSGSEQFGSLYPLKQEIITEIAAIISFSAIQNNDKIGVILFSDQIELFIPPRKGKSHVLRIIRDLLYFEPKHKGTDISKALRYFTNVIKKRSTVFLISDLMDVDYEKSLQIAAKKHDLIALKLSDPMEQSLSDVGMLKVKDPETGLVRYIDTSSKSVRTTYQASWLKINEQIKTTLRKSGVDFAEIETNKSYINPIRNLFRQRELKH